MILRNLMIERITQPHPYRRHYSRTKRHTTRTTHHLSMLNNTLKLTIRRRCTRTIRISTSKRRINHRRRISKSVSFEYTIILHRPHNIHIMNRIRQSLRLIRMLQSINIARTENRLNSNQSNTLLRPKPLRRTRLRTMKANLSIIFHRTLRTTRLTR